MRKFLLFALALIATSPALGQETIAVRETKTGVLRSHHALKMDEVLTWNGTGNADFYVIFADKFCLDTSGNPYPSFEVKAGIPKSCKFHPSDTNPHEYCLQNVHDDTHVGQCVPSAEAGACAQARSLKRLRRKHGKKLAPPVTQHCDGCFFTWDGSSYANGAETHSKPK